jgi:hypothetical protein
LLPYFPFKAGDFSMTMGTQALGTVNLIDIDHHYQNELALKNELLAHNHRRFFQALPDTLPLQWEALELVLQSIAHDYPEQFALTVTDQTWTWQNRLLGESTQFILGDPDSLPLAPLDWLGRQIQEDLLLLSGTKEDGMPLVAGQLCFPNAWCLDDKMTLPFLAIHHPVPIFMTAVGRPSQLLLERLKIGRPIWRVNWSLVTTPQLSLTPDVVQQGKLQHDAITLANIGTDGFVRIEKQTLMRLPRTNALLFTVHTYREPIASVIETPGHAQLIAQTIRTTPAELLAYKGITAFKDVLLEYLDTAPDF